RRVIGEADLDALRSSAIRADHEELAGLFIDDLIAVAADARPCRAVLAQLRELARVAAVVVHHPQVVVAVAVTDEVDALAIRAGLGPAVLPVMIRKLGMHTCIPVVAIYFIGE